MSDVGGLGLFVVSSLAWLLVKLKCAPRSYLGNVDISHQRSLTFQHSPQSTSALATDLDLVVKTTSLVA